MASKEQPQQTLFTCLSCSIAFFSAEEQRLHYRSDHHRYNMKRRVAALPPISALLFNQRVIERKSETAITTSAASMTCDLCNKVYTTENSYKSHLQSKKHRERELKGPIVRTEKPAVIPTVTEPAEQVDVAQVDAEQPAATEEEEIERTIEEKIAAARNRLSNLDCLFCTHKTDTFESNLTHMSLSHSFFIPDAEYLVDLQGLITYLGEKIAVGNVCIYCNEKSKDFRSLEAARKHMIDKGHCKLAYDSGNDRLELSDFYDFSSSYPDAQLIRRKVKTPKTPQTEEWEDVDENDNEDDNESREEGDEVVDVESEEESSDEDDLPVSQITYGDSEYELVLASGARIGHRSMRRYYAQSLTSVIRGKNEEDPNSGAALVRRLIADKNSALVPMKGGYGAFGAGTAVVKARNAGEAREAGRHVKEFRDMRRQEEFKTKVGFRHNSQKHFRDPLLQ
ncbi:cytoplasmic protein [Coprinopsis marcescibilis]|uniref:Cytoplasmic protein n=1 Tax=Coprinopsis marcescibilis TaxID=230819 RepID=A0A5C3KG77_COPMA|nr:cytoplasmic protein [Coprinopsis marcescibilis]